MTGGTGLVGTPGMQTYQIIEKASGSNIAKHLPLEMVEAPTEGDGLGGCKRGEVRPPEEGRGGASWLGVVHRGGAEGTPFWIGTWDCCRS